jgi:hypothetical protein
MSNVKFRGCCCGIPFGCGVLVLIVGASAALWKIAPAWTAFLGF